MKSDCGLNEEGLLTEREDRGFRGGCNKEWPLVKEDSGLNKRDHRLARDRRCCKVSLDDYQGTRRSTPGKSNQRDKEIGNPVREKELPCREGTSLKRGTCISLALLGSGIYTKLLVIMLTFQHFLCVSLWLIPLRVSCSTPSRTFHSIPLHPFYALQSLR